MEQVSPNEFIFICWEWKWFAWWIYSGWMDCCNPPVSTRLSVMVLIIIRLVHMTCSLEWWINAELKQPILSYWGFLSAPRVGPQEEWEGGVSRDPSGNQLNAGTSLRLVCLLLCDIYVCRKIVNEASSSYQWPHHHSLQFLHCLPLPLLAFHYFSASHI